MPSHGQARYVEVSLMETFQDKDKKAIIRVDGDGNIFKDDQARPSGRVHDGGIYDENGKLTGRYHGGKIYDLDGPWGGNVIGAYENGKIYDQNGQWGGNVIGHYSGDPFKEVTGCEPYRLPSEESSPTPPAPPVADSPSAPLPQQARAPATEVERTVSRPPEERQQSTAGRRPVTNVERNAYRPPAQPRSFQWKGVPFLLSKCRYCGAPAKGKLYTLSLILTPFALLFHGVIIFTIFDYFYDHLGNVNSVVLLVSSVITLMIFLVPGLAVLYVLRMPKGVCNACSQRGDLGGR